MLVTANPEINVEDLMLRIREEVLLRKQKTTLVQQAAMALPRMSEDQHPLAIKDTYALEEFLSYHDEDFVRTAYRAVLRREPDSAGLSHHLSQLRQGAIDKTQLIASFKCSPEGQAAGVDVTGLSPIKLPTFSKNSVSIDVRPEYQLAEFLSFHDEDFIQAAYRGVLHREVDSQGYQTYLHGLRQGELSKIEILGHMRYSPEGKAVGTIIKGLWGAFSLHLAFKLPVIGYVLALSCYLLRLPSIVKNFERFEAYEEYTKHQQIDQIQFASATALLSTEAALNKLTATAQQALIQGAQNRAQVVKHINAVIAATEAAFRTKAAVAQVQALVAQTDEKIVGLSQAVETKAAVTQMQALAAQTSEQLFSLGKALEIKADNERLTQLTNHLVDLVQHKADATELASTAIRFGEALAKKADVVEEDHLLDAFYVSFEDRFRGTREDIKQRVAIYLPVVKKAEAGTKKAPILDIGCGRGEWLQLLQESDLVGRGVDLNRVMVSQCQELGLEVVEADAIAYLRSLEAGSLGAVTGMHIIEHIPFKPLIALFDEVLRVLKPGGVAIFETPNPENLQVGACSFYTDPTHLNPLPPHLTEALLELRGFVKPVIVRPGQEDRRQYAPQIVPNDLPGATSINPMVEVMRDNFYVSADYALIAYKA